MDNSTLERVEAQRLKLEESIAKLKSSLRHWQDLELDYEGLKEEFELLPEDSSSEKCLEVARDFEPVAIKDHELQELVGDTKASKTPQQLATLLSKRVEYVARNVRSLRKELVDAEKKRNALLLAEDPDHRDEAGLPLTEITEELDDSGHVIASEVKEPGKATDQLAQVLEKAGVEGLMNGKNKQDPSASTQATAATSSVRSKMSNSESHDDEVQGEARPSSITDLGPASGRFPANNLQDTEEEAELRQEMLQYQDGLDEVGAIVAELDMAEGDSDMSYDEDDDDLLIGSDVDMEDDDEDSEDETGKSKRAGLSVGYRRRMEELEKKLGLKDMKNLGPDPDLATGVKSETDRPSAAEAARKAAIAREKENKKNLIKQSEQDLPIKRTHSREDALNQPKPKKKSVAFADSLDIANEEPSKPASKPPLPSRPATNPVGESVIERSTATDTSTITPAPPSQSSKKPSRFKRQLQESGESHSAPPPPFKDGQLSQSQVHERPPSKSPSAPEPSQIDDELHRREIALDYHRLRNRQIHAEGGYVKDGSDDEDFDDVQNSWGVRDQDGNMRKISRFKAARMKG